MNNNKCQRAENKNFKKALLDALAEYHGTITDDSYIYKPNYINCNKKLKVIYAEIQGLLPTKDQNLINTYDALKDEAFGYEADEIYLDGLKDAITILRILDVI